MYPILMFWPLHLVVAHSSRSPPDRPFHEGTLNVQAPCSVPSTSLHVSLTTGPPLSFPEKSCRCSDVQES